MTNADKVRDFVERFPGLDDDEVSAALRISPRQAVNQICRRLETQGVLERRIGSRGKFCNFPGRRSADAVVAESPTVPVLSPSPVTPRQTKPSLTTERLERSGFERRADWRLDGSGAIRPDSPLPIEPGVYAFATGGTVLYVGVATKSISKRLYFYGKPGPKQITNIRLNGALTKLLEHGHEVAVYVAHPPTLDWNGCGIRGDVGLELWLIDQFHLPWNVRGIG